MNKVLSKLINPYQAGFFPHRLISNNGWYMRNVAPDLPQVQ